MDISNSELMHGAYEAFRARKLQTEGSTFSDTAGVMGVLMVFPEWAPHRQNILEIITTAHQIDHHFDTGTGKELFNQKFTELIEALKDKKYKTSTIAQFTGFLSQAATVESAVSHQPPNTPEEIRIYRETINSIWTRMVVSFVSSETDDQIDQISQTQGTYPELCAAYESYRQGEKLDLIPNGEKSYLLYLWTMAIQNIYDRVNGPQNSYYHRSTDPLPNPYYRREAIRRGVNPLLMTFTEAAIETRLKRNQPISANDVLAQSK
jgi:hypothetical protein